MPIRLVPFDDEPVCFGYTWEITDEALLTRYVARVVLGQYRHIAKIIADENATAPQVTAQAIKFVQKKLELTGKNDQEVWHRDGWIFQVISWIAIQKQEGKSVATSVPHIRKADKGFDGIIVRIESSGQALAGVVVSEDKATPDSRKLVKQAVWAEITSLETGERDNELLSEVTAILERVPNADTDALIEEIHWKDIRSYRVAITARAAHKTDRGRARLFKGYDEVAPGSHSRRRAEMLHLDDVRAWMDSFCAKVSAALGDVGAGKDV